MTNLVYESLDSSYLDIELQKKQKSATAMCGWVLNNKPTQPFEKKNLFPHSRQPQQSQSTVVKVCLQLNRSLALYTVLFVINWNGKYN